jgi:hypothetical protein
MSKSIYEDALEIIINSILPRESSKQNKLKVIKALQKAQKQEKLLELYKTAHEKLLDLGWKFCEWSIKENFKQYEKFDENSRRTMSIRIYNNEHGIYYVLNIYTYVEKELSKILTQYLEELENEINL